MKIDRKSHMVSRGQTFYEKMKFSFFIILTYNCKAGR